MAASPDIVYTRLALSEVGAGLEGLARQTEAMFGRLDATQVNWRPDASRWSVAQCFEHLVTANRMMMQAEEEAWNTATPRTIWQRMPVLPGVLGRIMVRSQAPGGARKFKAPAPAQPAASNIDPNIIQRFVEQQRHAAARIRTLDERSAAGTIMASPFVKVVTYSALDGWRLIFAHGRRHFEQARRVTQSPGFPHS
jgi:hypothetical protein